MRGSLVVSFWKVVLRPAASANHLIGVALGGRRMSRQPLAEVRKSLRVEWYRSPISHARLRELSKRSDLQGWYQAGGHLVLLILTGAATYLFWSQELWIGFAAALFVHGTVGAFCKGVAPHELGHGTVFRTKRLNTIFLYIFSLISFNFGESYLVALMKRNISNIS